MRLEFQVQKHWKKTKSLERELHFRLVSTTTFADRELDGGCDSSIAMQCSAFSHSVCHCELWNHRILRMPIFQSFRNQRSRKVFEGHCRSRATWLDSYGRHAYFNQPLAFEFKLPTAMGLFVFESGENTHVYL